VPPTTTLPPATLPATTTTTPPPPYPPTTISQARALARKGDTSGFSFVSSQTNAQQPCPNIQFSTTAPSGLSDQQLTADLLDYFFNEKQTHGCGEVDVDASDGGDVLDYTDPNKVNPTTIEVDLPDGTTFNIGTG
jgi:hypothetical protein